jgi:hypothetical protein
MWNRSHGRRLAVALITGGAVIAAAPAAAQALTLTVNLPLATVTATVNGSGANVNAVVRLPNGTYCDETYTDTTPFVPWSDSNDYRLVPGGTFPSSGSGWSFAGGASTATTSNPYQLSGAAGAGQLVLPAGSSAISPFSCVDASQPTVRFMDSGAPNARLEVDAVFQESPTVAVTLPVGVLTPGSGWQPSPVLVDGQTVAGLLSGGTVPMALKFTATGATVKVSDAFVDPRMRY